MCIGSRRRIRIQQVKVCVSYSFYGNGSSQSAGVDPRLLILLHSTLLSAWLDTLTLVSQFLKHVDGPKGSNNDNKTLVTKAVEDVVDQSPINISALLDALKALNTRQFPTRKCISDFRNMYINILRLLQPLNGEEHIGHASLRVLFTYRCPVRSSCWSSRMS